jgi:hypothetical protein
MLNIFFLIFTYRTKILPTLQTPDVPWLKALTSMQFLVGCIANIGNDYGFHTLLTYAPKYMNSALGFDLQQVIDYLHDLLRL